jgi:hypothetical protein
MFKCRMCEIYFNYFCSLITNDARFTNKIKSGLLWQKQHSTRIILFDQQIGLKFEDETAEMVHLEHSCL